MNGSALALLELLLVFGAVLAFAVKEVLDLRKSTKQAEASQPRSDDRGKTGNS